MALVKPLHSGDPDVAILTQPSEVQAPCSLSCYSGLHRSDIRISAFKSNTATIPNLKELATSRLGGEDVLVQAEVPNSS